MDARTDEPARAIVHGLVMPAMATVGLSSSLGGRATQVLLRALSLAAIGSALVAGIVGGLLRAGVAVPLPAAEAAWPAQAVLGHAFLMMSAFMGSVIGIERAVAVKHRAAFAAPLLSMGAGVALLTGSPRAAAWLAVAAALVFVGVNLVVVERQRAPHTVLLLLGALAWLVGNLLLGLSPNATIAIPWWFSFLVLTIAAERLEMTRLMRRRRGTAAALYVCIAGVLLGAGAFAVSPIEGGLLFGMALIGLAAWLVAFDIARRTIAAHGLSRYMAVCLLLGYGWLGIAGAAWMGTSLGHPLRDMALHALGLGFVVSMMLAHAPVILPAVARIKVDFGGFFYVPLALLHGSLVWRLFVAPLQGVGPGAGALGNALAIALFALTMVGAAVAWRLRHPVRPRCAAAPAAGPPAPPARSP